MQCYAAFMEQHFLNILPWAFYYALPIPVLKLYCSLTHHTSATPYNFLNFISDEEMFTPVQGGIPLSRGLVESPRPLTEQNIKLK